MLRAWFLGKEIKSYFFKWLFVVIFFIVTLPLVVFFPVFWLLLKILMLSGKYIERWHNERFLPWAQKRGFNFPKLSGLSELKKVGQEEINEVMRLDPYIGFRFEPRA